MANIVISAILWSIACASSLALHQNDILNAVEKGVYNLTVLNDVPESLLEAIRCLKSISDPNLFSDTVCQTCRITVDNVILLRRSGASRDTMRKYLIKLCNSFEDMGEVGCEGTANILTDTILYIIDNSATITAERVCAIYLQSHKCVDNGASHWEIPLPPRPPSNGTCGNSQENVDWSTSTIDILHLTDIHYDPLYENGTNAVCGEPLCCQTGKPKKSEDEAGYWGDYHVCDMPARTIVNVLEDIKTKHSTLAMVYFTGDIISHKSYATTKESNIKTFRTLYDFFEEAFKGKHVFPILGNHESHPTNLFSPHNISQDSLSTQWLLDLAAEEWSRWLPEYTRVTIKKGGFYTVLAYTGFRIIALNSNVCFTENLWLFYEDKDPYGQLAWLVDELYKAEKENEKVHILSHIPPGDMMCHRQWSNQYRKIVNRFSGTIAAQFNGHTHVDEFRVFYNPENSDQVTNIAFNGGGFTTFVGFNSNYKIYQVQASNAEVENYAAYIFNLTKANDNSSPEWYKLYSFKEAYNLTDIDSSSIDTLLDRMSTEENILRQYYRFLVKNSEVKMRDECDAKCLKQLLCYITAVETDLSVDC